MITFLIRSAFYFVASFLVLSLPYQDATVFDKLSVLFAPYTAKVFNYTKQYLPEGTTPTEVVKKILTSAPPGPQKHLPQRLPITTSLRQNLPVTDSVTSIDAANYLNDTPNDSYTAEEKQLLLDLMAEDQ